MNRSISQLPLQLVLLLRRLVNVFSTFSLTNHYLVSSLHNSRSDHTQPSSTSSWLISVYPSDLASDIASDLRRRFVRCESIECHSGDVQHGLRSESRLAPSSSDSTPSPSLQPTHPGSEQPRPPQQTQKGNIERQDIIHRLMNNPTLFDPTRAPRYPIVLCHGLYGFDVRGPAAFPNLRLHYWSSVLSVLRHKLGAEVIVTGVPPTGSIASRAENLDRILQHKARGRGINLMAHSMGGLDCRHLISHVRPSEYVPLSLTSISTPHRGSPFMDWCTQHLGLGRRQCEPACQPESDAESQTKLNSESISSTDPNDMSEKGEATFPLSLSTLPSSFTTLLLSLIDSPAYANLTTSYLNDVFNPSTPDDPRVKYFSVASRIDEMNIWHPLWFPKMVLDDAERKVKERLKASTKHTSYDSSVPPWEQENEWGNDGLVTVQSARWGEFLGILSSCDHWEIRGARGMDMSIELPSGFSNRVASEGWALGDWSKFIGAWKKQERGTPGGFELAQATDVVLPTTGETDQVAPDSRSDPVVRASTDKLSAVFDWIVEHVSTSEDPPSSRGTLPSRKVVRNDVETKLDLERFYIALTRKLYDEGL